MPLPSFADEHAFRQQWIAPFLSKLGYILVIPLPGGSNRGNDFLFADYDPFEQRRYYAVQAKNGELAGPDGELDRLLEQVRRSFLLRLRFQQEADDQHITAAYVMVSRAISPEAQAAILAWRREQPFGDRVCVLDGEALVRLDKHALQRADRDVRNRLIGLLHEVRFNLRVMPLMQANFLMQQQTVYRCRYLALEQFLAAPPSDDVFPLAVAENAWEQTARLNTVSTWYAGLNVTVSEQVWSQYAAIAQKATDANSELVLHLVDAIRRLDERRRIHIEVFDE